MNLRFFPILTSFVMLRVACVAAPTLSLDKDSSGGVTVRVDGKVFASYVIDQVNKPFLWPVYGPTGKLMVRSFPFEKIEGEQQDHPHHRGILFGHESAANINTWHERLTFEEELGNPKKEEAAKKRIASLGRIVHREFTELTADADRAVVAEVCDYLDADGKLHATEERRLVFRATGEMRSIDFDQDLIAVSAPVTWEDRKDSGVGIRLPTSMAVDSSKGGRIVNSEGFKDAEAWGKAAKWCDYSGPVEGETLGVAILSHPSTFRYPTRWHVRPYGLFAANPFASSQYDKALPDASITVPVGERLKLRHRFVFHKGDADSAQLEAQYGAYAKETK